MKMCEICKRDFNSIRALLIHLRSHNTTIENYVRTYIENPKCFCGKPAGFISLSKGFRKTCNVKCNNILLAKNRTENKTISIYRIPKNLLECPCCSFIAKSKNEIRKHLSHKHFRMKSISAKIVYEKINKDSDFLCHYCKKNIRAFHSFFEGFLPTCGERKCRTKYSYKKTDISLIEAHQKIKNSKDLYHNGELQCPVCEKKVQNNNLNSLISHITYSHSTNLDQTRKLCEQIYNRWFLVDGENLCVLCSKKLNYKGGFSSPYNHVCENCFENNRSSVWYYFDELHGIRESISKAVKKYNQTEEGKIFRKKLNISNKKKLKEYFQTEEGKRDLASRAKKHSILMRKYIKEGKFTPNITNSWTHWNTEIEIENKKRKYRSTWDMVFHLCNPITKYEKIRIQYFDEEKEKNRNYIVDFIDEEKKILYEVKPKSNLSKKEKVKHVSAIKWCKKNNHKFVIIAECELLEMLKNNIDEILLHKDENIRKSLLKFCKGMKHDRKTVQSLQNKINQEN
jgi:hypothetical protein